MPTKTKVRFYKEDNGILAVFPEEKQDSPDGIRNLSYSWMDSHALSDRKYHYKLPKATREEYQSMEKHLEAIGYELIVLNKE